MNKTFYRPSCFPAYYYQGEGHFLEDGTPILTMGRTCGHFRLLVVFTDTASNRGLFAANADVPARLRAQAGTGDMQALLQELLATYTPGVIQPTAAGLPSPLSFTFTVIVTPHTGRTLLRDATIGRELHFTDYDAVLLLDDLGTIAGQGIRRWPLTHPLFAGHERGYVFEINPRALAPGLLGNELLRRNYPTTLAEYVLGEVQNVVHDGLPFHDMPIVNPRTGEDLMLAIRQDPLGPYLGGYRDIDHDSIVDCVDPAVAPTADNIDGDFVPDRYDPDLSVEHKPLFWTYAPS
jgi:hypothetical protein